MTTPPTDVPPPPTRLPGSPSTPSPPPAEAAAPRRSRWVVPLIVILTVLVVGASVAIAALIVRNRDEHRAADAANAPGSIVTFDPPLTRDERRLLEHIPFVVDLSGSRVSWQERASCGRAEFEGSAVASFGCELDGAGAETIRYTRYPSLPAMSRAYDQAVDAAGVDRYRGACKDGAPAEGNWQSSFSGAVGSVLPDGRVLCVERDGVGTIVWSHDDLRVVSETSSSEDWKALYRFWSTVAGPFA